ncbi:LysR family transcriptional regulator [Cupriavidus basilensis]|uniref:LysR family transcriptional regulator n=1 Tax=Cupriavidus basilensis TaxID=68895 RepID=UPI0007510A57|nr:LysR family transcriptional regulator [Cupriavidus basilensis]
MPQDQLDGLATFVCVAEFSSFSAAAVRLGVSPSAVSQSVRMLEKRVGFALFNRTTRSVSLTEAGAQYLARIGPAVRELIDATEELGDQGREPGGLLRLNVPRSAYMIVLQPILERFLAAYPQIDMEICIENSLVDIVGRGFDAGIRFGNLVERDMVAVPVGPKMSAHVVASPEYLRRRGTPAQPDDLTVHCCIGFRHVSSGQVERWDFRKGDAAVQLVVKGRLVVNDSAALVQAALDGLGIAYMINGYIDPLLADGRLVRVLADWSPVLPGLTLYYPDRRRVPNKLRAFIDFLAAQKLGGQQPPTPRIDGTLALHER